MIKFELPLGYYITRQDDSNLIIAKDHVSEKGERSVKVHGYYQSYEAAWNSAVKDFQLKVNSLPALKKLIKDFEELKVDLLSHLKP